VAVARARGGRLLLWPGLAAVGVLLLTQPWQGGGDLAGIACALGAAGCWACYILLTQAVGDELAGLQGLAVSLPVAGAVSTLVAGPVVIPALTPKLMLEGLGLALLLPVVPFSLEMYALRRLTTAAFGTLMCLEPAIALIAGFGLLHQLPGGSSLAGVAFVVTAGIGAQRSGARPVSRSGSGPDPAPPQPPGPRTVTAGSIGSPAGYAAAPRCLRPSRGVIMERSWSNNPDPRRVNSTQPCQEPAVPGHPATHQATEETTMHPAHRSPHREGPHCRPARGVAAMASPSPGPADLAHRRHLQKTVSWTGCGRLWCLWYRLRLTVAEMNYATRRIVELQTP
jgi:hypothetical protein